MKRATVAIQISDDGVQNFNPRPREEGDTYYTVLKKQANHFNPRPREEGDTLNVTIVLLILNFNPRPREEGDVKSRIDLASDIGYYNPRPREEGDRKRG